MPQGGRKQRSHNNTRKALSTHHLIPSSTGASRHQWRPYLCWPSVCFKASASSPGPTPPLPGHPSQGVDLEAPNSPVLANYSSGIPKIPLSWREGTAGRTKSKGNQRECGQLPGIQCHSSPCRILVVWGRRAPSVRSSPLRCLETRDRSILNQHIFNKTIHTTVLQFQSNNQRMIA